MRARGRRRPWRRRLRLFFIYTEIFVLLVLAIILGVVGGTFYSVSRLLPSNIDLADYKPTEVTKIYSSDGVVLAEVFEEMREVVPIDVIPQDLQDATIAIEDKRFYKHFGVDVRGTVRALYQNLQRGRLAQGGSTLTQQLARNIYLTREKKFSRKLQEMVLAVQLERNYSKEQILELYLNEVFYGSGSYGVQTASRVYFGKQVQDLTLAECALLAGLPQKPSSYSPYDNLKGAKDRRNVVLDQMAEMDFITPEERDKAKAEEIKLVGLQPRGISRYKAPWFVMYVLNELKQEYGADLVYRGGLRVHTTLNYEMQKVAEEELRKGIANAKSRRVSQGALVCVDPVTGYIKAMVGGVNPDFTKDQFNRAVQAKRQPGSAFKAFVYTAAIDAGYDPDYRVSNQPITYKGKPWPRNYSSKQSATTYSIRRAVAESVNICAVRMTEQVGIDQVIRYAKMMGINTPLNRNFALALGASEVVPLEICSAYGVFAAKGLRAEPMCIVKITGSDSDGRGGVIKENKPVVHRVLSEQTAETMNEIFRGVVISRGGTGYAAGRVPNAHGKTGTTQNDRTAWWLGYTPELSAAVWVGNDDNSPMNNVWGGNVCAPIWSAFMLKALKVHEKESPQQKTERSVGTGLVKPQAEYDRESTPQNTSETANPSEGGTVSVNICRDSGLIATPSCPSYYKARMERDAVPTERCPLHGRGSDRPNDETSTTPPTTAAQPNNSRPTTSPAPPRPGNAGNTSERYVRITICVDSGQIANEYCPETVPRTYRSDEVPSRVCRMHGRRTE